MRALLLILIASSALGQGRFDRFNQRTDQGRSTRGFEQSSYAYFEFAPASGAGMGTACACTTPTGAKGEALTFTRAGDATCSKQGLATTGIANGDLVACTANQPRVESSGGVLGLRVESARTNETLRSTAIENVVWATTAAGVAAPTITADFAVAPDGTTTADRMQIPACPAVGNASGINQTSGTIASPSSSSVYLKANAGTPSVSICMYGLASGTRACTQFALNTSTWTRAVVSNVTNTGGMNMEIACENRTASYTGATDTGAADILVWGAQSEAGAYATSYIPTVAAAVTRGAESVEFPSVSVAGLSTAGSAAITLTPAWTGSPGGSTSSGVVGWDTAGRPLYNTVSGLRTYDGTNDVQLAASSNFVAGTPKRYYSTWAVGPGVLIRNQTDALQQTGAFDGAMAASGTLSISTIAGANDTARIVSSVCLDPSPTRCR